MSSDLGTEDDSIVIEPKCESVTESQARHPSPSPQRISFCARKWVRTLVQTFGGLIGVALIAEPIVLFNKVSGLGT